jgi:hypothetical protein
LYFKHIFGVGKLKVQAYLNSKSIMQIICGVWKTSCRQIFRYLNILPVTRKSFFFSVVLRPNAGHGFLILEVSRSHTMMQQSVGHLWMSNHIFAETLNWQHTIFTTDKQPCPQRDSNSHLSRRLGADLHLWPCGYWNWQLVYT